MPFDACNETTSSGPLTHATLQRLRSYFDRQNHHPSADHWTALEQVVRTMEAMANNDAPAKVFLSSLDCGVGKTTATIHFAQSLVQSPQHRDIGMLICVGRLTEATDIAEKLNIPADRLAVLTSDAVRNQITDTPPNAAQVLVTTQQRLERATDGRSFTGASAFYYRGKPREVRVWDEAWLPGIAVTLTKDELLWLPKMVRPFSAEFADALPHFALAIGAKQDGDMVEVPDFEALYNVSLYEVLAAAAGATGTFRDDQQIIATALLTLNGKTARVRRDGKTGNAILTYRDTFPADLAPLLVLDASGRVRQTYTNMEQHRDMLVRLQPAVKDYSPLTIHTWKTSGAKSGWERQGETLAKGIADTVLTKPTEDWLVVVHKAGGRIKDVEAAIRRHLQGQLKDTLKVITWGQHMATNEYADVANVVLAGTLFMRDSFYTALTHLSLGRDVAPGLVDTADIAETMRGEHRHLVYQAICRGRVRKSDGDKCQPMTAYVIASPRSGIPQDLCRVFPGCRVRPWNPTKKALRGNLKRAVEYVAETFAKGVERLSYGDIRKALGLKPDKFRETVARAEEWTNELAQLRLEVVTGARGWKSIQRT